MRRPAPYAPELLKISALTAFELSLLAGWAVFLLHHYLNFDPLMVPYGREYFTAIQTHFMWERARECGPCAMWNGSVRGGYPVFADVHDSMLFPPVIIATYIWGVFTGAKIALIVTFFLAGLAQWLLGKVIGLGGVARIWGAGMAIAAGGLAGRMDDGAFSVVVSAVCCALVIPAAIQLGKTGTRRSSACLAVAIALALVAGQGYLQLALIALSPLFLLFIIGNPLGSWFVLRRFVVAAGIGAMIAAPFLHFYPSFGKWTDPIFDSSQPLQYVLLNLVINDSSFFHSEQLSAQPYPYLYINYVGWIAISFAIIGCYVLWHRKDWRLLSFLLSWSLGALWISSAQPLIWVRDLTSPESPLHEFVIGLRNPPLIAGLAVPTILALSAIGVQGCLDWKPKVVSLGLWTKEFGDFGRSYRPDRRWLIFIPLFFALRSEQQFGEQYLRLVRQPIEDMAPVYDALKTPAMQWVDAPFGDEYWIGQAIERNLKLSYIGRVWMWNGRQDPMPVLEASQKGAPDGMSLVTTEGKVKIYAPPSGNEYAAVTHPDGTRTVCSASGIGGNIDVRCDLSQPGTLQIKENYFSGWKASASGESLGVSHPSGWIEVALPAGQSTVQFRYRPWDVPAGIGIMFFGLALAGFFIVRREPERAARIGKIANDRQESFPSSQEAAAD